MSFTYVVKADISNITQHTPRKDDRFLVDTNVLFWWFYPGALDVRELRKRDNYTNYLKKLRNAKSKLCYTSASLIEIANVVEKTLYDQYKLTLAAGNQPASRKEFRHSYDDEREELIDTVDAMWESIEKIAHCLDTTLTLKTNHHLLTSFMGDYRLDSYDYLYLQTMHDNHITRIITDDGDFSTIDGIEMYTDNTNIIEQAREQDRLRTR